MSPGRLGRTVAIAVIVAGLGGLTETTVGRAGAEPMVTLSQTSAEIGQTIVVSLEGWPREPVTVSICGNLATRGTQDCDLRGARSVGFRPPVDQVEIPVVSPPAMCPCVVRAVTADNAVVSAAPLGIATVPTGPIVGSAHITEMTVTAHIDSLGSAGADLVSSLGGPTHRSLLISVSNIGHGVLNDLVITASRGREADTGEPLGVPVARPLGPGESAMYRIPFVLPSLSFGTYTLSGGVHSRGQTVRFVAKTKAFPWALVITVVLSISVVTVLRVKRARRDSDSHREPERAVSATPANDTANAA